MDRYNNKIPFDTKFLHVGANSTNYTEAVWDARPLFIGPPDNITTIRTIIVEDVKEGLYKSEEIEVELSNLSIADVTLNPSHPVFNEPVNVTVTIKNNENETANATLWLYNVNTTDYEIPYCTAPKGDNLTIFYPGALNMAMHFKEMYIIPEDPQGYCRVVTIQPIHLTPIK
ncbi:MAG: hypothetical protein QMD22_09920 [archaeon]|nr:hypothetical protein [archaeon]